MSDKLEKAFVPIVGAIIVTLCTAAGTGLYRHEIRILANNRAVEQLRIKDYRQHRDMLREIVWQHANSVTSLTSILDADSAAFGPGGKLILDQRKEQLRDAIAKLENYVEENKHYGKGDG